MLGTDERLAVVAERQARATRAKQMRPATAEEADALRDLLRQDYPGAAVRTNGKTLPVLNVFPQRDPLEVGQANEVRDLLRFMGFVELADGSHIDRSDCCVRVFSNLLVDCDGAPAMAFVPAIAQRRLDAVRALEAKGNAIARDAVCSSGFTKHSDAELRRTESALEALRQRPGTIYLEGRINDAA